MIRRYMEKVKNVMQWGKILLPLSSIRFYPPQFILRNPVEEGVTAAINNGHEVAVIVFNLKDIDEISDHLDEFQYSQLLKQIKKVFRQTIEQEIAKRDIITLHDFFGEGLTLFIKVDYFHHCLSEINTIVGKII